MYTIKLKFTGKSILLDITRIKNSSYSFDSHSNILPDCPELLRRQQHEKKKDLQDQIKITNKIKKVGKCKG